MSDIPEAEPALIIDNITKLFPGVRALDSVSFQVRKGEVHAVVGENGAGKSTLMKILAGALAPDQGKIIIGGKEMRSFDPETARDRGIAIIYQEYTLLPHLSVAQNISLGREPRKAGWINRSREYQVASRVLKTLDADLNPGRMVRGLSVAQRQLVEIAKGLSLDAEILIMDEPTSALSIREREQLFLLINKLRGRGISIIYVSHSLEEIFQIADRATVLKDGCWVGTREICQTTPDELITLMVGRKLDCIFPPRTKTTGKELLSVRDFNSPPELENISLSVKERQIVGLYGLVGAGRTELAKALFGARPATGEIRIEGRSVRVRHPRGAVKQGMALLTEDRKTEGLIMGLSVRKNMALASLDRRKKAGIINVEEERREVHRMVERLDIRTSSTEKDVFYLSGGNQQKVVIGKWLLANPRVLICDEPTRGVDVGAKMEIYRHLRHLADQGMAILMISSELPEIMGLSDHILVMRKGRLAAGFDREEATEEKIMRAALGQTADSIPEKGRRSDRSQVVQPSSRRELPSYLVVFSTLLALILIGIFTIPNFLGSYNLTSIIRHATGLGIVAMGQAIVMIAGGVDLSVSSTITLTTITSASIMSGNDKMIVPAILASVGIGLVMGTINGISVVKLKITPFIATLGTMSIGAGIVLLITHTPLGSIGPVFRQVSRGTIGPFPSALYILLAVFGLGWVLMNRMVYGRWFYALGGSREVSRLMGINVRRIEFCSYLVSGLFAVATGLYLTSRMGIGDPRIGPTFALDSIIVVLIGGIPFGGGKGSLTGVIAGVLLMAVLGNLLSLWNLQSWYHQIARAIILLAAISLFKKE